MSVEVLLKHSDFLIVNKPAGLAVHSGADTQEAHLLDEFPGYHLINRLDKETSGIVVLTASAGLVARLTEALQAPEAIKLYRALLRGGWKSENLQISWDWPISDKAEGRKNPQGLAQDRKAAKTQVSVMQFNQHLTEVECLLKSGRQHQIRKHAALAKHPVIGDPRYNDTQYNLKLAQIYQTQRMFLHAEKIEFFWKSQRIQAIAALDADFQKIISGLSQN